jgi:hypothetical protein
MVIASIPLSVPRNRNLLAPLLSQRHFAFPTKKSGSNTVNGSVSSML